MTAPRDDVALREHYLNLALEKEPTVAGALLAAHDMYRWRMHGVLPQHLESAAGASFRKDEETAGASVTTDSAASVRATPAVEPDSPAGEAASDGGPSEMPSARPTERRPAGEHSTEATTESGATAADGDHVLSALDMPTAPPADGPAVVPDTNTESGAATAAPPPAVDGNIPPIPTAAPDSPSTNRSHWTPERDAEFRTMWERGDDTAAIADHFRKVHGVKLTPASVHAHASKRGIGSSQERNRARHQINARRGGASAWRGVDAPSRSGPMKRGTKDQAVDSNTAPQTQIYSASIEQPQVVDFASVASLAEDLKSTGSGPGDFRTETQTLRLDEGPPRADTTAFSRPMASRPDTKQQARHESAGDAEETAAAPVSDTIARIRAAAAAKALIDPSSPAAQWPERKREVFTAAWKAGRTPVVIAAEIEAAGYPMKPRAIR